MFVLAASATGALSWVMMPLNADFYLDWVYFDPQTRNENAHKAYLTAAFCATSGSVLGQWLAFGYGLMLADARRRMWPCLALAALAGAGMAAVNGVVASRLAPSHVEDLALLHDPGVERLVAAELAAYPLLAIAGVGLGRIARRMVIAWLAWPAAVGACAFVTPFLPVMLALPWPVVFWTTALLPPVSGQITALAVAAEHDPDNPAAAAWHLGTAAMAGMLAGALLYAVVLNLLAQRRAHKRAMANVAGGAG